MHAWKYILQLLCQISAACLALCNSSMQCSSNGEARKQVCSHHSSESSSYQLVLYQPPQILQPLHERERRAAFGGREWVIHQQWESVGVAAVVWEAALVLCHYLEGVGRGVLVGKRVIELGAGTGLVGLVAHALGASDVIITDRNTLPAEANLQLNSHQLDPVRPVSVSQLSWGQDPASFLPPFDVILAADVVYIEETFPLLIKSLCDLSNADTSVLLSCKYRYKRDLKFFELLKDSFTSEMVWSSGDMSIHRLRRRQELDSRVHE